MKRDARVFAKKTGRYPLGAGSQPLKIGTFAHSWTRFRHSSRLKGDWSGDGAPQGEAPSRPPIQGRTWRGSFRTSLAAASASGSPSPARWRPTRG
jgi:hypothetical protein